MVSLYDYLQFSLVCKSWYFLALRYKHQRSIITSKFPQLPMLIVPSKDGLEKQHCLYDPTKNRTCPVDFKFCFNKRCCGSSFGWLIMCEETLDLTLFNPFSGTEICLPSIFIEDEPDYTPDRIVKAILTKDPSLYPNDYMVIAIYGSCVKLCLMRSNDKSWTYYYPEPNIPFSDVNVYGNTIYASGVDMMVWKVEVKIRNDESSSISISVRMVHTKSIDDLTRSNITVSSKGELLLVLRSISVEVTQLETNKFKVYKLTEERENGMRKAIKVKSLDGDAMFIGDSQSICVSTKDFPKCLPNCIYFMNGCNYYVPNLVQDSGIFYLEDKDFGDHYIRDPAHENLPPPIWIIPTICSKDFSD
ncbi:uncharacterized protein LOC111810599 [Cucurbita pepo subsp. pepo]|uniref:uncharacterized protein LOC111810599 n=1 Tax=Cucurbita pepo subsp. pepo TaxID=3664 RepID=UPI000C9D5A16|nr:uncharacterized protein LOC111810599 [Cucurbita pepo subsp. pepo]